MFKFDFNLDEVEDDATILSIPNQTINDVTSTSTSIESSVSFNVSSVPDLIPSLPSAISYSPLKISVLGTHSDERSITLLRRDLFDARFQLSLEDSLSPPATVRSGENSEQRGDVNSTSMFVDAPSDLIAGVYEGGLKTWECSMDLAGYLANLDFDVNEGGDDFSILEIGCGTAIPSLYCLKYLFGKPPRNGRIIIHLQDYNIIVLKLVTLPNVILTWYTSSASETYRKEMDEEDEESHRDTRPFTEPGELSLTSKLITAFQKSLEEYHVEIKLISGSWQDTNAWILKNRVNYNLVLSSESIYRISSLSSLITLLKSATSQKSETNRNDAEAAKATSLCLIAAKVIYFGVGGGVESFLKAVTDNGGRSGIVFETKAGVTRKIMKINWS